MSRYPCLMFRFAVLSCAPYSIWYEDVGWHYCSSLTTLHWPGTYVTGLRSCIWEELSKRPRPTRCSPGHCTHTHKASLMRHVLLIRKGSFSHRVPRGRLPIPRPHRAAAVCIPGALWSVTFAGIRHLAWSRMTRTTKSHATGSPKLGKSIAIGTPRAVN